LFNAYPDRKWLLIGMLGEGAIVFPTGGGVPLPTHLHAPGWVNWTGDGKHLFVSGEGQFRTSSYVLPLSPGQVLPERIAHGKSFPSEAELAKWPGVQIIPIAEVVPGPTADVYAFTREGVQRNIYRIPLP
jgi:hypothetical protein